MNIKIIAFGQLADITNKSEWEMSQVLDFRDLQIRLYQEFPALITMKFVFAVNRKIVSEEYYLWDGCEVALLPPFSGG